MGRAARGEALEWAETASNAICDECIIWPFAKDNCGYASMGVEGENRTVRVHAKVCELAHGPRPLDKDCAAHSCGVKLCINPAHLRWATRSENAEDMVQHGTAVRGSRVGTAKLSTKEVLRIRRDKRKQEEVAEDYGVSPTTIGDILTRRTWDWLK